VSDLFGYLLISHKRGVAKIVYVHAMKDYLGRRSIVTLMLDFGSGWRWVVITAVTL
jgi:hypothetical protein